MKVRISQYNGKDSGLQDVIEVIASSFYEAGRIAIMANKFYIGLRLYCKNNNTYKDLLGYTYKMERVTFSK